MQHQIDPCRDAGAGQPLAIFDIETIFAHERSRRETNQFGHGAVMRRAFMAIEKPRPRGEQRAGTDRDKANARPHGAAQPGDDLGLQASLLFARRHRPAHGQVGSAGDDDIGAVGQPVGKRLDARDAKADRASDAFGWSHISHAEGDALLLKIGLAQHLHRTGEIEQQHPRWHHGKDRNLPRRQGVRHAASFSASSASASWTLTIRAKRPASTSSVRARISAGLQIRPAGSVIGKVSVASPT